MNVLLPSWASPVSVGLLIVVNGASVPMVMAEPGLAQVDIVAETHLEQLGDSSQGDGQQGEGDRLFQSGLALQEQGELEAALAAFEAALALYEEIGDRQAQIDTLNQMGNVYLDLGQHEQASVALQGAIALQQQETPQSMETTRTVPGSESQPISGTRSPGVSTSDESSGSWGEPGGSRGLAPSSQTSEVVAIAPPDMAQPGWGEPGGSRGSILGGVQRIDRTLVALVDDGPALSNYPTLFIYLPDLVEDVASVYGPLEITITLLDSQGTMIHESSRLTPDTAGILGIPLADLDGLAPLLPNQVYEWQLQVASPDPDLALEGAILTGRIEQVDGAAVEFPVDTMTAPEDYSIYEEAGIWYDAVAILFSQWQFAPDEPGLASDMHELLLSVGLGDCTSQNCFIGYWSDLEEVNHTGMPDVEQDSNEPSENLSNIPTGGYIPANLSLPPRSEPGGTR